MLVRVGRLSGVYGVYSEHTPALPKNMSKTPAMTSYTGLKNKGVPVRVLKNADISSDCDEVSIVEVCTPILAGCLQMKTSKLQIDRRSLI